MKSPMDYAIFSTPMGWMVIAGSSEGIAHVVLPVCNPHLALKRVFLQAKRSPGEMQKLTPSRFGTLPERLIAFLQGEQISFPDRLDRRDWTGFRSRVWDATRLIPYGETRSYGWVAAIAGQPLACRAAGQALHHNPVPIIVPCHRVIGANGSLTGFGSGLATKQLLLSIESGQQHTSVDMV